MARNAPVVHHGYIGGRVIKWSERDGQWVVEKMMRGKRLFRRIPGSIGREQEAEAREIAAGILHEFRDAALRDEGLPGYIYAISHPAFPGLLKIGRTNRSPESRCGDMDTYLPTPCALEFAVTVKRSRLAESEVHRILAGVRVNLRREWFRVSVSAAAKVMSKVAEEQATPPLYLVGEAGEA